MFSLLQLLAPIAALTLSHAAVIEQRQTNCGGWYGNIQAMRVQGGSKSIVGHLDKSNRYTGSFEIDTVGNNTAEFYFNGCPGGPAVPIYCSNCGDEDVSQLGLTATAFSGGQPTNWWLHNAGPDGLDTRALGRNATRFLWGKDSVLRPVTYDNDGEIANVPEIGWFDSGSATPIIFISGSGPGGVEYYFLAQIPTSF